MASPLMSKVKRKQQNSFNSSTFLDENQSVPQNQNQHFFTGAESSSINAQLASSDQGNRPLDISKIQNSSGVSSSLNDILKKVNNQKEEVEKDLQEQQEKTKDFEMFQHKVATMNKQSMQKEREFEESVQAHSASIQKYNSKKADLESKYNTANQTFRDLKEKNKEVQEQQVISKQQFEEQLVHKEDIFEKTLANKDKLIADLQAQINNVQAQFEKAKGMRIAAENELRQKEEINMKMKDRIEQQKRLIDEKKKDQTKENRILELQRQNELRKKGLQDKMNAIDEQKGMFLDLKERKEELEHKRVEQEHRREKIQNDLDDRDYLLNRLEQVQKTVDELKDQKKKVEAKIQKKSSKVGGAAESSDELQAIIDMILRLSEFERTCQVLDDQLRAIETRLHLLIEEQEQISSQHLNNKDKLLHSIGKQKGQSSTGGLGFLIKHAMITKKMDELKEELVRLRSLKEKQKKKLDETLMGIHSKNFEKVTKNELEHAIIVNEDVKKEVENVTQGVEEAEKTLGVVRLDYEKYSERMRQSYIVEVQERIVMGEEDNAEVIEKIGKVIEALRKFEVESEKQQKLMRNKDKKEEVKRLKDLAQNIKDDSNEIKANLNLRKNQIDKAKRSNKDIDKLSIGKLCNQINDLKGLDNLIEHDRKDVNDVERRLGDLSILFRDIIKSVIKDIFNELESKMNQRNKQLGQLIKKDQNLLGLVESRKNELFGIQTQLEDDDLELVALFKKLESTLNDSNQDEESGSVFLRQLQSQTDRLSKQVARVTKENFNQEEINELLDQLDSMDSVITSCDSKLEDGLQKAQNLESQIQELDLKVKIERIHECESEQKVTSETQEKLKRILDRMQAQINVIEKDQNYLADEFNDMEKKKERLAFTQELDKRQKEYGALKVLRDKYKTQRDVQEQIYEEKQRVRDQIVSAEFQRMKKESVKLREDIQKVIDNVQGPFNEEINACKEIIQKMVKKYKNKKDKFQNCIELKMTRESEILVWRDKLLSMRDRIQMIEGQLGILGVNEEQEGVEIYKRFLGDIDRLRLNTTNMEKSIAKFQERISDESEDLDQMETKIVKTVKLEDIEKALEQIGMQIEGYEKEVEKFDLTQKQIEKEVEAFMNKIRSSQLFDCEQKIGEVETVINQLIKKLHEVGGEVTQFKQELSAQGAGKDPMLSAGSQLSGGIASGSVSSGGVMSGIGGVASGASGGFTSGLPISKQLANRDELTHKSEQFVERVDQGGNQRNIIQKQLEFLKGKLGSLDKKTVSMNEIYSILSDAQTMGVQATTEIKKANDVQEELRQLNQEWKDKSKLEGERSVAVAKAKELIKNNQEMLQKMKVMLNASGEKVGEFDVLYKAMVGSDDYNPKRGVIEKKMRRMAQLRSECGKLTDDKEVCQKAEEKYGQLDIDSIEDLEQLKQIIAESEKVSSTLVHGVKDLGEMGKGFEKKRAKIADAEIRQLVIKRKNELVVVSENIQVEMKKLNDFEAQLMIKKQELAQTEGPNSAKSIEITRTLEALKKQFSDFKSEYDKVEDEIRNVSVDIESRDLEKSDPLPKLARDIERLKAQSVEVKELKFELEKFQIEFTTKRQMLSGMDTEKKLKQLLTDVEMEMVSLDEAKRKITKVVDIAKNYDGYTSGAEDEEFFQVMAVDGSELNKELLVSHKNYSDMQLELQKLSKHVEDQKLKNGGQLSADLIDEINDKIEKIEGKVIRGKKTSGEICAMVEQNQEKVSQHDLENKVDRRGEELNELDKIIGEIEGDANTLEAKIKEEIELSTANPFYEGYCKKLEAILTMCANVKKSASKIKIEKEDIQSVQKKTRKRITLQVEERLEVFYPNLDLKKSIQNCLKQIGEVHTMIKKAYAQSNDGFNSKPKEPTKAPSYKFDPNDEVDKLFAEFLNKLGINIPIKRLGGGYYMFGTKKIFCKIINGKLVVRVGGGYMGIEEFIMQYGQQEADKCKHISEVQQEVEKNAAENSGRSAEQSIKKNIGQNLFKKGVESPKGAMSVTSAMSDNKSVSGASAGMSSFLKQAASKKGPDFDNAVEEAKKAFKNEETKVGTGAQTTTAIKKPPQSVTSAAGSVTSKAGTRPAPGKK